MIFTKITKVRKNRTPVRNIFTKYFIVSTMHQKLHLNLQKIKVPFPPCSTGVSEVKYCTKISMYRFSVKEYSADGPTKKELLLGLYMNANVPFNSGVTGYDI